MEYTQTHTNAPIQTAVPNFPGFKVPRRIAQGATLATLNGDQLRLLVYLAFRAWGGRCLELPIADSSIVAATGMTVEQLDEARYQLSVSQFIGYALENSLVRYTLIP